MRAILIALLWLACAAPVLATGRQEAGGASRDAEAIAAYRAGDLETARSLWLELLEAEPRQVSGAERARVLYNLGNLAVRDQEDLRAVGYYTASLRLRPRDPDARANLEFARLAAGLPPADRGDLSATVNLLLTWLTRAEAGWLALFSMLPLLVALTLEALRGGRRWRWGAVVGVLLALVGSLPLWVGIARGASDPVLVVAADGAPGRADPRADADLVEAAEPGTTLERVDDYPGWVRVELDRGRSGWVRSEEAFALKR